MKSSTLTAGIAVFVILGVVGGGLTLFKMRQISAANNPAAMPEYGEAAHIADVKEIIWQPTSSLVGTAFSLRSVAMANEVAGIVKEVKFQSGSIVNKGDVLLTLDDSTEQANLSAANAAVRVAEANAHVGKTRLSLAELELKRTDEANALNASSPVEIDRRRSAVESAKADADRLLAEVDQAKARVEQVKVLVEKHIIHAPFRGHAGIRTLHEGQYLAEGTTFVALEEITERIFLDFAIPQEHLARVHIGLVVKATGPIFGADGADLEVVAVDARVSNDTRNGRVRGMVDNREGRILPGMFVQIRVPVDEPKSYIAVPATAIRRATYGDHVWVVVQDVAKGQNRATQRAVKLGPSVGEDVIVLEGLKSGERIATTGSFKLREGVLIKEPTAVANAAVAETATQESKPKGNDVDH